MPKKTKEETLVGDHGVSLCDCKHVGDVSSAPGHVLRARRPSQHVGQLSHGRCIVKGCKCQKFTWNRFLPMKKLGRGDV